jgi:hypothetical protein
MSTRRGSGERVQRPGTAVVLGRGGGSAFPGYDRAVTATRRAGLRALLTLLLVSFLAVACSTATPPSSVIAPRPSGGEPRPSPALASASLPATTDTEFGRVWDGLPPSWPALPGQSESEVGTDASALLVVKGDPTKMARAVGDVLHGRGWIVDIGSPLEDGSVVLDATGDPDGCKVEARFQPNDPGSNDGSELVYYGAACPFD